MISKPCFCRSALACLCGSAGFFERSAKSLFGLRLCARLGLAFLPCSARWLAFVALVSALLSWLFRRAGSLSFWAECVSTKRKIHALRCNPHFKFVDTSLSLSMTRQNDKQTLLSWLLWAHFWAGFWACSARFFALLGSAFACRKRLIANSVPNLPFVCQANPKTKALNLSFWA